MMQHHPAEGFSEQAGRIHGAKNSVLSENDRITPSEKLIVML
jgi:hypothetical protein